MPPWFPGASLKKKKKTYVACIIKKKREKKENKNKHKLVKPPRGCYSDVWEQHFKDGNTGISLWWLQRMIRNEQPKVIVAGTVPLLILCTNKGTFMPTYHYKRFGRLGLRNSLKVH